MHDAAVAVTNWTTQHFRPQVLASRGEQVVPGAEAYDKMLLSYVECSVDRAIAPILQRHMKQRAGCRS